MGNSIITTHKYLDEYPISNNSRKLIVGTIHAHVDENFKIDFFYGNRTSLWEILREAFPNDLTEPLTLEGILTFLKKKEISVSDTIRKCERKRVNGKPTALDKDLIPIELNSSLIESIKKSKITDILFTSGFKKNNAFRLFYVDLLGQKITKEIEQKREVTLDKNIFGRTVKLTILFSPSGSANVGISKSKLYLDKKKKYENLDHPVSRFRVDYYRDKFNFTVYKNEAGVK